MPTRTRFGGEQGRLRARLARWHKDVDNAFYGWNGAWLDPDFRKWDITEFLAYIRVPVLIVQGEDDQYGTIKQIEMAQQECYCPVEVALLPGARHSPQRDAPASRRAEQISPQQVSDWGRGSDGGSFMNAFSRSLLRPLCLVAGTLVATSAFAQAYVGVGVGQGHAKLPSTDTTFQGFPFSGSGDKSHDTSWKLYAGYQFTPNWGLEAGYNDVNVERFEAETGRRIPVDGRDPLRFEKRYRWLMENARQAWIDWRCRKIHDYYVSLARRLAARRGKQRAAVAVGHSLLVTGYHLITRNQTYQDLGANYFDERDREGVKRRALQRLEQLGFQVQLTPVMALAA